MDLLAQILFVAAFVLCFSGWVSPPLALTAGIVFGLSFRHPYPEMSRESARSLLQISVIALGFGINLHQVWKAGGTGFVYTVLGILVTMGAGLAIGKWLKISGNTSYLITCGTAICGGSAIAAIGPILRADGEEMAIALAAVFILNAIALLIFPPIGNALHLSQAQFGMWSALAIHDTSSVVGATAKYGQEALIIGTTVKLARALWIVPMAVATAAVRHNKARVQWPWFILFFCTAAVLTTYVDSVAAFGKWAFATGRLGLTATLFLIGSGLSVETVKGVGWRPMLQAVLLWILAAAVALLLVSWQFISF
jgi:uncharacterized integral membrane protein (TIGR00698 family)